MGSESCLRRLFGGHGGQKWGPSRACDAYLGVMVASRAWSEGVTVNGQKTAFTVTATKQGWEATKAPISTPKSDADKAVRGRAAAPRALLGTFWGVLGALCRVLGQALLPQEAQKVPADTPKTFRRLAMGRRRSQFCQQYAFNANRKMCKKPFVLQCFSRT